MKNKTTKKFDSIKLVRQLTSTAVGITFNKEEQEKYNIKVGRSRIDISDMVVINEKEKKE